MLKRIFILHVFMLCSLPLFAGDNGKDEEPIKLDETTEQQSSSNEKDTSSEHSVITVNASNPSPQTYTQQYLHWFKTLSWKKLTTLFTLVGGSVYGIYKGVSYVCAPQGKPLEERLPTITKGDQSILLKLADTMTQDINHLKENDNAAASAELFDLTPMENKEVMQQGEMVKRTFVYLFDECKESPEDIERLEGFTQMLKKDIQDMPVAQ